MAIKSRPIDKRKMCNVEVNLNFENCGQFISCLKSKQNESTLINIEFTFFFVNVWYFIEFFYTFLK